MFALNLRAGFVAALLLSTTSLVAAEKVDQSQLILRVRVTALTPDVPVRVKWRYGGEGQGGSVTSGEFTRLKRVVPTAPKDRAIVDGPKKNVAEDDLVGDIKKAGQAPAPEAKTIEVEGGAYEYVYLKRDSWSPPHSYVDLQRNGLHPAIYTVTLYPYGEEAAAASLRGCEVEFELSYRGKVLKTFKEAGPDGPTFGLALGSRILREGAQPTEQRFLDEVSGLAEYSRRRTADLAALPWAHRPVPKLYAILTDCAGYKPGLGYGCRTTNMKVMENEFLTLRQLGMNGVRGCPLEILDMANRREGWAAQFTRARISGAGGYPLPRVDRDPETGKIRGLPDGAGDPFYPGVREAAENRPEMVQHLLDYRGFDEVWGLTVDEIGNVFSGAAEGRNLIYTSPYCMAAFRDYLQQNGVTLADVAAKSWDEVDPWTSTGPRPPNGKQVWEADKKKLFDKTLGFAVKEPALDGKTTEKDDILLDLEQPKAAEPDDAALPTGASRLPPHATNLIHYYIARFVNYASAKSFEPTRDLLAAENAKKQAALDRGDAVGAAKQPWIYSYALRGQTFIRRHSLDFFEFYRHADNAIVYETSHTDRVTQIFDSYICDVGRIVSEKMDKKFGIYVKAHRGSGNQRAMSFVARGGTMLYWYTYGPGWFKGDSFSTSTPMLHNISRFARILARAEDVLYGAKFAERPTTAIVKSRTNELYGGRYDNIVWNYAALAHSHVPVDPLDETMLETEDLSHYQVIYIGGEYLRRASAVKLAEWVRNGGTLYTADQGMMWDEAKEPLLDVLGPVFGIHSRDAWEAYDKDHPAPPGAELAASGDFVGGFTPSARETLTTAPSAEVLVRFKDGKPAVVRNKHGQGSAYLVAFPAGSDYGRFVRTGGQAKPLDLDMEKNADPGRRRYVNVAALERVQRPVTVSKANVEAVLVRHPKTGKRAIPLMNWAYLKDEDNPRKTVVFTDVVVTLAAGRDVTKVTSAWLDRELPIERDGELLRITLPELDDCDAAK